MLCYKYASLDARPQDADLEEWEEDFPEFGFQFNRRAFVSGLEDLGAKYPSVSIGVFVVDLDTIDREEAFGTVKRILSMGFEFGYVGFFQNGKMNFHTEKGQAMWDRGGLQKAKRVTEE